MAEFSSVDLTNYILMSLIVILAIIMIRIVFSLSSKRYKDEYVPKIEYCLTFGFFLGVILYWNDTIGLVAALVSIGFFLFFALYSMLSMGVIGDISLISQTWIPREKLRRWFSYFSIIEASMGITVVFLHAILSTFFSYPVGTTIMPLAFATIAILTDLFELTFPEPPYRELFSLLYIYYDRNKQTNDQNFTLEDTQFPSVLKSTDFTIYELREALERLVREEMAEREMTNMPIGQVRFNLNKSGIASIMLEYEQKMLSLSTKEQAIQRILDYFKDEEMQRSLNTSWKVRKALKVLNTYEQKSKEFFEENRYFLEKDWLNSILSKVSEQKEIIISRNDKKQ